MNPMRDIQRLEGWKTALRALWVHPWRWSFGWGPETFRAVYRLERTRYTTDLIGPSRVADHAHNLPLELLVTVGAVGTAAFAYFVWRLWEEASDEGRAALLGVLVLSMVEPVFFPPAAMLALILGSDRSRLLWRYGWSEGARVAAGVLTALAIGIWVDDATSQRRSLFLHPHESEANQQAIAESLAQGRYQWAVIYAQRAANADPMYKEIVEQADALEATVRRRGLR